MKVERERLIAYIRIVIIVVIAVSSYFIKDFWSDFTLTLAGFSGAFIYSIAALLLVNKVDEKYLHYFTWIMDLLLCSLLIYISQGPASPYIFLLPLLILSAGLGYNVRSGLIAALIISALYLVLHFLVGSKEGIGITHIIFNICFFFACGLLDLLTFKPVQPAPAETIPEAETPVVKIPSESKIDSTGISWQIPKTLDEAYSVIRMIKEEGEKNEKKFQTERQKNNTIRRIAHNIATQKEIRQLYMNIVTELKGEISSQAAFIMRLEKGRLAVKHNEGNLSEITMNIFETSELFFEVLSSGKPIRLGSEHQEVLASALAGTHDRIKSLLLFPLKTQYDARPFGIIGLANYLLGDNFIETDEEFLKLIAIEAAIAIKNIEYIKDIEKKYDELILSLARAIEAKDDYTHDHVDRVRELSERLARALGLPEEEVRIIKTAATLHDVGKIATPDGILKKRGKLDDSEWVCMKEHTIKSATILKDISSLERDVLNLVLHHHERYDGKGYPDALKGDNIPVGARIIAVADTFDAMTSDRPYRKGFPEDVALKKMKEECYGTQFDPVVLEAFLRMMSKRAISKKVKEKRKRRGIDVQQGSGAQLRQAPMQKAPPAAPPGTPPAASPGTPPAASPGTPPAAPPGTPPAASPGAPPAMSQEMPPEIAERKPPRKVLQLDANKKNRVPLDK